MSHKVNLPSCVARRPLCHKENLPSSAAWGPLCHKENVPWSEARRRHFIMTCDIFGTGQTKIFSSMFFYSEKTYKPAFSSATQVTEINTLDQITENWYWREHTDSTGGFDDSLEMCERNQWTGVKTQFIMLQRSPQKMWSDRVFNINTSWEELPVNGFIL